MGRVAILLAISLALIYISLSPGSVVGMGYTGEDIRATTELLRLAPDAAFHMPRNGVTSLFADIPFIEAGALTTADRTRGEDMFLSLQPPIFTALLVAILFWWMLRLGATPRYAFILALVAAFCTMLWPYAYIGLETQQSLFLLIAGYLALEYSKPESVAATCLFAIFAALALASKSTGAFLLPAVAFLGWRYAQRGRARIQVRSKSILMLAIITILPLSVFVLNSYARSFFWRNYGGSAGFISFWLVRDPISPFLNFAAFFGSPNKGLWIFSPVCLLACYAIPRALMKRPYVTIFALLATLGLAGGFSLLRDWSDETWGPRYLHSAICPLLLLLVAAHPKPNRVFRTALLPAAAALGLCTSFLGLMFPYGCLSNAANKTGQNTLEAYQGDITLNHLRFNAALLAAWWKPHQPQMWGSDRQWFFDKPSDAPAPKWVDLRDYAIPQPILIRHWSTPKPGIIGILWGIAVASLLLGLLALAATIRGVLRFKGIRVEPSASPALAAQVRQ